MKHIVVAFDSFKGSLSSQEANEAFALGFCDVVPDADIRCVAISDGGEGFAEAAGGRSVETEVSDPLGRPMTARYTIMDDGITAVVALASASGLTLLDALERNPLVTNTYGTGEIILDALRHGCRRVVLGLGGSATNDGGTGLLRAFGCRFMDGDGCELTTPIDILERVVRIDTAGMTPLLRGVELSVVVDVDNPLCGERGAARVYARQKGASESEVMRLDAALAHLATIVARSVGEDYASERGMGAAGGTAFGLRALLGTVPTSGIDLMLDLVHFDDLVVDASLVVTGEGRVDCQTVMGKAPSGILRHSQHAGVPCVAVGGSVVWCEELDHSGFAAIYAATPEDVPLDVAMQREVAAANLRAIGRRVAEDFVS